MSLPDNAGDHPFAARNHDSISRPIGDLGAFLVIGLLCLLVFGESVGFWIDATTGQCRTQCSQTRFRYGSTGKREFFQPRKVGQFRNGFVRYARAVVEM